MEMGVSGMPVIMEMGVAVLRMVMPMDLGIVMLLAMAMFYLKNSFRNRVILKCRSLVTGRMFCIYLNEIALYSGAIKKLSRKRRHPG